MVGKVVFNLTVAISLMTGSAAGLLSLLTWETLRRSPFGRAVSVLSLVMVLFIIYHVLILLTPTMQAYSVLFESALMAGVAIFIWLLIWSQHRMKSRPTAGGKP
jgi:hypothetical protein